MLIKIEQKIINNLTPTHKEYDIRDIELKGFLVRVQKSGNASYVLAYKNKAGKNRRYKIANVSDIKATQARQRAQQLKLAVANSKDIAEEKKTEKQRLKQQANRTISAFLSNRYVDYVKSHHANFKGSLDRLAKFKALWGDISLENFDLKTINCYRESRLAKGIAASTINRDLNCLRGLFRLATEEEYISVNPFEKLKPLKTDKNPITRFLTTDEENRLIDALSVRQDLKNEGRSSANVWREDRNYEPFMDTSKYRYSDYLLSLIHI